MLFVGERETRHVFAGNAVAREGKSKYVVMTGDQYAVAIPTNLIPQELT